MRYPKPLPPDDQLALCALAQAGDLRARDKLIASSMGFVWQRAHRFARRNERSEVDDLVNEGVTGLLTAIRKFDSSKGVLFLTYAAHWVNAAIQLCTLSDREVRASEANRGHLSAYNAELKAGLDHEAALVALAAKRGEKLSTVRGAVEAQQRRSALPLDAPVRPDGATLADVLGSGDEAADDLLDRARTQAKVQAAIQHFRKWLRPVEADVLDRRILDDEATLGEVASPTCRDNASSRSRRCYANAFARSCVERYASRASAAFRMAASVASG